MLPSERPHLGPVHALLVAALAAAVALVLLPGRAQREHPQDLLRALRAARGPSLPEAGRVGASSATPLARYNRDSLYEVIDGAAEGYLARGFSAAAMTSYAFPASSGGTLEVSAEAHRFSAGEGAQQQLEAERPKRAAPLPEMPEAVSDGTVLLARLGPDLLKLTVVSPAGGGAEALAAIAGAWRREQAR